MKSFVLPFFLLGSSCMLAQTYTPVTVTGYNLDAIAESSPAAASTFTAIDGSDYVLYSAAYGTALGTNKGLPNSGTVTSGTRTYQMNPYSGHSRLLSYH